MNPEPQHPQEEVATGPPGGKRYTHPAFAQISAGRVQSTGTRLYGSDFVHNHFVRLSINRSELNRSLSHDRPHPREQLVEVWLSESQWATMISTLNQGTGAQCTLARHDGRLIPPIAEPRGAAEEHQEEVGETLRDAVAKLDEAIEILQGKGCPKQKILAAVNKARQEITTNLDFVVESFGEHMEERVDKAKTEVATYMDGLVARAGLQALQDKGPLALGPGEDDLP